MFKRIVKIVTLCFFLTFLYSCSDGNLYQYRVIHTDNSVDTITIKDISPTISEGDLVSSGCGCDIYAINVKNYTPIGVILPTKAEIEKERQSTYMIVRIIVFVIVFVIVLVIALKTKINFKPNNNKQSTMLTIIKYIIYAGGIVITFKIVILLVKYLPAIVESYLK